MRTIGASHLKTDDFEIDLNSQAFDNPPVQEVLFDNFVDVFPVSVVVPNPFGINNDDRAFLATIEAPSRIDAYAPLAGKTQRLDARLGVVAHGLRLMVRATGRAIVALVRAEKYVVSIVRHASPPPVKQL
jgi:hypothetical protein